MRFAAFTLIVAIGLTATAEAQTRFAAPHSQPSAESTAGLQEPLGSETTLGETANAEARARMDKFEQRIATRSDRAIRSICGGCNSTATRSNWASRRIEANAEGPEFPIKDPAQAPAD